MALFFMFENGAKSGADSFCASSAQTGLAAFIIIRTFRLVRDAFSGNYKYEMSGRQTIISAKTNDKRDAGPVSGRTQRNIRLSHGNLDPICFCFKEQNSRRDFFPITGTCFIEQ